ncbi:MAG TPA: hypothetical protein VKZ75_09820 [Cyclobacteriaceae bacterium]|nr:hypothetical protein [Cyclobacteriaceae bacterium]
MPEQVLDIDDLLRRVIYVHPNYVRPDQTVTSFAFTPRKINGIAEEGLSVDISRFTTYEASIKDRARYRLYSIQAGQVRNIGLNCIHDPVDGNYAHALIIGEIKRSTAKRLSQVAVRVPYP